MKITENTLLGLNKDDPGLKWGIKYEAKKVAWDQIGLGAFGNFEIASLVVEILGPVCNFGLEGQGRPLTMSGVRFRLD